MKRLSSFFCFRRASIAGVLCGLFFAFAATAFAGGSPTRRTVPMLEGTKAEISLTPIAEVWLEGGFFAVQVKVDNRSEAAQSWSIQFTSERTYRQKLTFTKEINVGPRSSLETIVLVPGSGVPFASRITTLGALVVGPWVERSNLNLTNFNSNVLRQVATSASQEVALFAAISAASGGGATSGPGSSGPGGSNDQVELSVVDAAAWPADWRVWSPFTLVVMTDPEFRALDGARRAALLDWVALGGTLSLFPPFTQGSSLIPAENWGRGGIIRSEKTLAEVASPESLLPKAPKFPRQLFDQAIMAGNSSGPQAFELSSGSIGVTLFLVLFALLIGPVNLLLFAPAKSRQRLFFTVPLISLGASLVLGLVIVWRDGFGGEGVQRGLIMLLPGENKAVVVQDQLSRTGVLFSERSLCRKIPSASSRTSLSHPTSPMITARETSPASAPRSRATGLPVASASNKSCNASRLRGRGLSWLMAAARRARRPSCNPASARRCGSFAIATPRVASGARMRWCRVARSC